MSTDFLQRDGNGFASMITEIKFACPHCGQKIAVGTDAAGLGVECPSCQNPVTIPRGMMVSEPRRPDVGFREKVAALQSECEKLRANATHAQAEIKSFHNERLTLRNEAAALKQRVGTAEAQLAEMQLLSQRLEATETQLSSLEAERKKALRELEDLRSGLAAAVAEGARLKAESAAAQARLSETEARLTETQTAFSAARAEVQSLQNRFTAASTEAEALRHFMDADAASRELLSTRTRLFAAEDELAMRRQSATQLEMDLLKAEADRERLEEERTSLHRRVAETMKQAEELSKDRLNADNAKLRELLERQNEELKLRFKELTRFRRAKLTLKIVWALAVLAAIGLGFLFVKILPSIEWSR